MRTLKWTAVVITIFLAHQYDVLTAPLIGLLVAILFFMVWIQFVYTEPKGKTDAIPPESEPLQRPTVYTQKEREQDDEAAPPIEDNHKR